MRARRGTSPWITRLVGSLLAVAPLPAAAEFLDPRMLEQAAEADAADEDAYDPLSGLDENGRIPAIRRPENLKYPDRWRYLPEGRLKPGSVLDRFLVSSFITPYVFRSRDVGTGVGLAISDLDFRQQRRQERSVLLLSYTSEGQREYRIKWRRWLHQIELPEGGILTEERSFIDTELGYSRTLTHRFFGLGGDTDEPDETSYTEKTVYASLDLERSVPQPGSNWVFRLGASGASHRLTPGKVSNRPSTDDVYPGLFADAQDHNMGWLRLGLRYDTRDSQQSPYRGWHIGGLAAWAPFQSGGDTGAIYTWSASKVFRTFSLFHNGGDLREENPPTDTVAFGFRNQYARGELPFFELPSLGGTEHHRGFIAGRFRDRASWLGAAEYRFWFLPRGFAITRSIRVERVGAALFYEVGAVGGSVSGLFHEKVRHSYGASLRVSFDRVNPLRFDFGFSEEGMEFSLAYGLSF